jgi:GH25 family lysozyme M1 (1,4-beta-N-acetylmuramidase)
MWGTVSRQLGIEVIMAVGIDIYRYQTVTDWHAVRGAVTYVWVKVSDGGGPAIVRGDAQVGGARSVGLPVGGYHYAQLDPTPEQQADVLLSEVDRLGAHGLVPMLDIEAPFRADHGARVFAERFCNHIASRGRRPGVYMNNAFAKVLRPDTWPVNPVIWIARYGARPDYGGRYDVHQYSSSGSVPGISGAVDMNESYTDAHFDEEFEMTPEQDIMLRQIHSQITGDVDLSGPDAWGFESFVDPAVQLTPVDFIRHIDKATNETRKLVQDLQASVDGLTAAVAAVSNNPDLTKDEVAKIVKEAVQAKES